MEKTDVVIVGGGPAGSTTASLLAKGGAKSVVLEKETFPRFHIGESMLPQSQKVWHRLGVMEKLHERYQIKYGARFLCSRTERQAAYYFEEAFDSSVKFAFQVPRADFDDMLLRHAEQLGADVRHGWEVKELIFENGTAVGVRAKDPEGNTKEIRARVVVDATGRDTLLASRTALKQKVPGLDKTALFTHWSGVERQKGRDEGNIDIVTFPHGWWWNIPFRGDVNSVGVVCSAAWIKSRKPGESLDAFYARTVEDSVWMRRLLANAKQMAPVRAIADYSYRVDRYGGNGWVMVGDGAGFIDPLFSTGAHLAFSSGAMAADEILDGLNGNGDFSAKRWEAYERRVRRAAELFMGAVQAFYDGPLSDRIFEQPQRKILRQTITSMLAGDVFDDDAVWVRFLRDQFPAHLPSADGERAAPGATPILTS
jgi:flavin-dependent dehydrogenase